MSNNTHFGAPPKNIMNGIITTDYRPSKALYVDVYDNNSFRKFLQRNGNAIRNEQLMKFEKKSSQTCEIRFQYVNMFNIA